MFGQSVIDSHQMKQNPTTATNAKATPTTGCTKPNPTNCHQTEPALIVTKWNPTTAICEIPIFQIDS